MKLNNHFYLKDCPLNPEDFKLNIVYEDDTALETNILGIKTNVNNYNNQINNYKKHEYFYKFLKKENEDKKKGIITNYNILTNKLKSKLKKKLIFRNLEKKEEIKEEEEEILWDMEESGFKCRVDNKNKINVYYQNSFDFDQNKISLDEMILIINFCQDRFLGNDYPIVVIEDANGGGYVTYSMIFSELVQNLFNNQLKCSINIGKYTSSISNDNLLYLKFLKENGDVHKKKKFLKDTTTDKLSNNIKNKRLKQKPFSVHLIQEYKERVFRNKYKKPTEIIIYTDGFSFSATSLFIKSLYHFGGAIIVGYNGDPETKTTDFDASQSPTFILNSQQLKLKDNTLLNKYGFNFNSLSYGPSYKNQFIEEKLDYPEEFQVTPVDERVDIYNEYDDSLYQNFIDKAKEIFKKYNVENKCNKDNKNLKMLNPKCDNEDKITKGGYECGDDGKWSETCKPFYCDKNYYFDYISQKCVKDVIAEKYQNNVLNEIYSEITLENKIDNLDDDVSKYKGLFILFLILVIIIFVLFIYPFIKDCLKC